MKRRRAAMAMVMASCGCAAEVVGIHLTQGDAATQAQRSCTPPTPAGCGEARIEGGTFQMGDPMALNAAPVQQRITVSAFVIDRYEVTVGRFRRFVAATRAASGFVARTPSDSLLRHCNWTAAPALREDHPMNCVAHATAEAFCRWDTFGGGLPSEAQWEYAARGRENRPWPWGGAQVSVFDGRMCGWTDQSGTCPEEDLAFAPGATPAPESVWHLLGNVWEWTADWFLPYADTSGACWNDQARVDPLCLGQSLDLRGARGGAWESGLTTFLRSGARGPIPFQGNEAVGFRCARTAR